MMRRFSESCLTDSCSSLIASVRRNFSPKTVRTYKQSLNIYREWIHYRRLHSKIGKGCSVFSETMLYFSEKGALFKRHTHVYHYRILKACNRFVKVHGTNVVPRELKSSLWSTITLVPVTVKMYDPGCFTAKWNINV